MTKIYFDLDGTLFDLYNQEDWLPRLRNEIPGVFIGDSQLFETVGFYDVIEELMWEGVKFGIISWLPMQCSDEYGEICREEKLDWIHEHLPFISEIAIVPYGTPKQNCIQKRAQKMILIDDNHEICAMWETKKQRIAFQVTKEKDATQILNDILHQILQDKEQN